MRTTLTLSSLALAVVACHASRTASSGAVAAEREACEPLPRACVTVSGQALGQLPLEVPVGEGTVRFAEWTQADASSTAFVGFAAQVPEGIHYTVAAGGEQFEGQGSRWLNPRGVDGPRVHGIDEVTFCVARTACARHHGEVLAVR